MQTKMVLLQASPHKDFLPHISFSKASERGASCHDGIGRVEYNQLLRFLVVIVSIVCDFWYYFYIANTNHAFQVPATRH